MTRLALSLPLLLAGLPLAAHAQWTATGRFLYTDRLYASSGWTGSAEAPIRWADVQIVDHSTGQVLANGYSDEEGYFSITVADTQQRTVYARALTSSLNVPDLRIEVADDTVNPRPVYGLASAPVLRVSSQVEVAFGSTLAPLAVGTAPYTEVVSQAFNTYDMGVYAAQWVEFVEGSRPTVLLRIGWNPNRATPRTGSSYGGGNLNLADDDGYDDANILHEIGHYLTSLYSRSNSPGGSHGISDPHQDPRLSWGEGLATWFSGAILQHFDRPHPHIYSDRNSFGTSGGFWFQYETVSSSQRGPAAEVGVTAAMWDIIDSSDTADSIPGDDDDLALPDSTVWSVLRHLRNFPPAVTTIESFWDRWFILGQGHFEAMRDIFAALEMHYYKDEFEPDNNAESARPISLGVSRFHTFYGSGDADWMVFENETAFGRYQLRTTGNNYGLSNPVLEVFGPDAQVLLGRNVYESANRFNNQNARLLVETLQPGPHFIRLSRLSGPLTPDTLYGHCQLLLEKVGTAASITRVLPRALPAGARATLSVQGQNLAYHTRPHFPAGDILPLSWEVLYPELLVVEVVVEATAAPGPRDLVLVSPYGTSTPFPGGIEVVAQGGVVLINEIRFADSDGDPAAVVELANLGPGAQDLTGWRIVAGRSTGGVSTFDQFAGFTLHPGLYLQVFDTPGNNDLERVYDVAGTFEWPLVRNLDGAVELRNAAGELVDYMRYNRHARFPRSVRIEPTDAGWGRADASGANSITTTLGRTRSAQDSNQGRDWQMQAATLGRLNSAAAFTSTPTPVGFPHFLATPLSTPTATATPTPTATPTVTPTLQPGDLNGDHRITEADVFLLASCWQVESASIPLIQKAGDLGREGFPPRLYGDLNQDGVVDDADLLLFIEAWQQRAR